jgi:hypothetical protein
MGGEPRPGPEVDSIADPEQVNPEIVIFLCQEREARAFGEVGQIGLIGIDDELEPGIKAGEVATEHPNEKL